MVRLETNPLSMTNCMYSLRRMALGSDLAKLLQSCVNLASLLFLRTTALGPESDI